MKAGKGIGMQQITTYNSRISDLQKLGPYRFEKIEFTFNSVSSLFPLSVALGGKGRESSICQYANSSLVLHSSVLVAHISEEMMSKPQALCLHNQL